REEGYGRGGKQVCPGVVLGEPGADRQEDHGGSGELELEVLENLLELGDHEDHDHRDHADGDADDHRRVNHGADDFFLELGGLFHEIGKAGQDEVEHAARLAGRDHVAVEL